VLIAVLRSFWCAIVPGVPYFLLGTIVRACSGTPRKKNQPHEHVLECNYLCDNELNRLAPPIYFFRTGRVCNTTTTNKKQARQLLNYFSTATTLPKPKSTPCPRHILGINWSTTTAAASSTDIELANRSAVRRGGLPTKNSDLVQLYEGPRKILFLPTTTGHTKTINIRYGASLGGTLCDTSKTYVRQVRLTSHESKPHKKHNSPNKHHHHGGGAANPCSGADLMNPRRPRGGRPCACSFRCCHRSDLIDSIN